MCLEVDIPSSIDSPPPPVMIALSRILRCDVVSSSSTRHSRHALLNSATPRPPVYRLPPPQFAVDSQFKFKVEAEARELHTSLLTSTVLISDPMDIGDIIMKVCMSKRHTVVLQAVSK